MLSIAAMAVAEEQKRFIFEVEKAQQATDGRPSAGPVYRSVFADDGFPPPVDGMNSCWDIFRIASEKYPGNRMLGRREFVDGKGGRCGIYGANCPEWIISMEINEGDNKQYELPLVKKSDICTIMYTSGTTGDPKGVMISNDSIVTLIAGVQRLLQRVHEEVSDTDVYVSYLPLAHIFDRVMEEMFIFHGASIGFWRGDVKLLIEDLGELKPTVFCAVPRVLDRYCIPRVRQGLGGNVRLILSGAAPLATHVEAFLKVVTCAHVVQGYGLTETCAGTFVSLPNELSMLGTVGPPVPNVDVRLESVPEMAYDANSSTPRGEICIRGDTLFSGYYKRDDLTKEVMVDGWFHTGDIGEWQADGSMKIIDRKKNIFKLSQGEYVAVENLENIYGLVPEVDAIWIYGNSFKSFLVAVINPNEQALACWAQENKQSGDFAALCMNVRAKEYVLKELTNTAKAKKLKGFEFLKAIHLDPVPFDMERDLITPTYKKKRPQLLKYYQVNFSDTGGLVQGAQNKDTPVDNRIRDCDGKHEFVDSTNPPPEELFVTMAFLENKLVA
ncbi:hypothetical protein ACLOJK_009968 [Asimina triloba]